MLHSTGVFVKPLEILILTLLFIGGFFYAEIIVHSMLPASPIHRFLMRVGLQLQFYATIYLFFETRDISGRLRKIERDGYLSFRDRQSDKPSAVKGDDDE